MLGTTLLSDFHYWWQCKQLKRLYIIIIIKNIWYHCGQGANANKQTTAFNTFLTAATNSLAFLLSWWSNQFIAFWCIFQSDYYEYRASVCKPQQSFISCFYMTQRFHRCCTSIWRQHRTITEPICREFNILWHQMKVGRSTKEEVSWPLCQIGFNGLTVFHCLTWLAGGQKGHVAGEKLCQLFPKNIFQNNWRKT